ncbi:MAG: eukaryotic-like serine/threonine-protein kinase [Verrucomicrobiota bacterium]|jgi:serine/threonine protein kinase
MEELDLGQTIRGFKSGQKVFRRYTLVRILGRGGMGVVWLAKDEELDREVALKFLPDLVVHDLAVLDELKRETRRSLQLTHHNIVRIHDFVQDAESACISMEYVDGPTLSALRVEQPSRVFEPEQLAPWVEQICEALQYAHQHARIVHRDIKPANLMLNGKGDLKVADFGIARSLSDSVSMLTLARGTSGTLAYMSPQQLDGERASNLDDIYSLGATLYELATSKPPFHSGGIERLIREKTPASLAAKREELGVSSNNKLPAQWEQTIAACLAKDPAARPQTALEVRDRLRAAPRPSKTTSPLPITQPVPTTPTQPVTVRIDKTPPGPTLPFYLTTRVLATGAAVLLVIAGGAFWRFSASKETDIERNAITPAESPHALIVVSPTPVLVTPSPVTKSATPEEIVTPVQRTEPSPSPTTSARGEREEIEAMVATQIEAGTRGDVAASMALYADNVDFYDEGLKTRDDIAKDLPDYFAHWPVRRSKLIGDVTIEPLGSNERKVDYTLDFEASNPATREKRQNIVNVTWIIRRDNPGSSFKIISHKQKSVKQQKALDASEPDGAIAAVKNYFAAVNNQDGTTAYQLFGSTYRTRVPFQEYLRRLKTTGTLTLNNISRTATTSSSATVEVTFQEVESNGKVIRWHGPISLVVEKGEWHIDTLGGLKSDR